MSSYSKIDFSAQRGFTLVELISVMVIIGILAAVAVPRFFDATAFQSRAAADQVRAALRYGQKVAIAQRGIVTVNLSAVVNPVCGIELVGGGVDCQIPNTVNAPGLPLAVSFNGLGQPVAGGASILIGGTTINIAAETGYVE